MATSRYFSKSSPRLAVVALSLSRCYLLNSWRHHHHRRNSSSSFLLIIFTWTPFTYFVFDVTAASHDLEFENSTVNSPIKYSSSVQFSSVYVLFSTFYRERHRAAVVVFLTGCMTSSPSSSCWCASSATSPAWRHISSTLSRPVLYIRLLVEKHLNKMIVTLERGSSNTV